MTLLDGLQYVAYEQNKGAATTSQSMTWEMTRLEWERLR
jgi:hypothetical protein